MQIHALVKASVTSMPTVILHNINLELQQQSRTGSYLAQRIIIAIERKKKKMRWGPNSIHLI